MFGNVGRLSGSYAYFGLSVLILQDYEAVAGNMVWFPPYSSRESVDSLVENTNPIKDPPRYALVNESECSDSEGE